KELGFDPIWFGVIIVMTVELGLIHPPVGMNIFVIKSVVEDVKISTIFYGVLPFIVTDILRLIILLAFPIIALSLPSKMLLAHPKEWVMVRTVLTCCLAAVALRVARPATCADARQMEENKKIVAAFYDAAVNQKDFEKASQYLGARYTQHNPLAADGR